MRSTIIKSVIFVIAAVVTFGDSVVSAQEAGRVAILDVAKVFKENDSFKRIVDTIKKEADQATANFMATEERLKKKAFDLRKFEAGPKRNQMEAELEQQLTALRTTARQTGAEFISRESRVFYDTYREMQVVVEGMAKEYGLSLVLRFDSEVIDPNNQEKVRKGLKRTVIFHRQIDLTKLVSDTLNARMASAKTDLK